MSDETKLGFPNPWKPEQSPLALMHLGKLGEELGEAQAAVSRCIIQGINESEPETHKPNKQWLEDELADVMVNIHLVIDYFRLDQKRMSGRTYKKMEHLKQWHKSHSTLVCNNCYTEHDNPGRNCTNAKM
jgi:NTP pyrophosphatase (non-canonical NTP hydrolase)